MTSVWRPNLQAEVRQPQSTAGKLSKMPVWVRPLAAKQPNFWCVSPLCVLAAAAVQDQPLQPNLRPSQGLRAAPGVTLRPRVRREGPTACGGVAAACAGVCGAAARLASPARDQQAGSIRQLGLHHIASSGLRPSSWPSRAQCGAGVSPASAPAVHALAVAPTAAPGGPSTRLSASATPAVGFELQQPTRTVADKPSAMALHTATGPCTPAAPCPRGGPEAVNKR